MAFRLLLRQRAAAPVAATLVGGATIVYPWRTAHAEAPPADPAPKKPIYDDPIPPPAPKSPTPDSPSDSPSGSPTPSTTTPTPTDRLAEQVGHARLFLYRNSLAAEQQINHFMTWVLKNETSLADTVASLAPSKESGEQLLPGGIYVLVAAMAGSIVTRNRNILLRSTVPVAVGIATGWFLIPVTMRNVADLCWEYEKKVPPVAESHMAIRGFTEEAWRQTKIHGEATKKWVDRSVTDAREVVEGWVKKGK